ncbi:MAG: hypothetical protein SRB2_04012 [Desulfobacteraceae bacterium Eth-SRB2]|nr:MAG: hypothetical protein SRB2_04012 [Desulfobacteraceae bacterium Eth-SRB2]
MSYHRLYKRVSFTVAFLFFLIAMQGQSKAGSEADKIQEKVVKTIEVRQETQKKEDAWAGKKAELTARYRSLSYGNKHLEKVKKKTGQMLNSQKDLVDEAKRKIEESARIQEELQACLESIITRLEEFIKRDLPFLPEERSDRLALIKETLASPDRRAAEKYRRVMEALQIETGYGHTVEVYQDTVDLDSRPVLVDILRLGRLSLFCQTPDGKVVGHYDRAPKRWISLSSGYRRDINKAVEMARHERTIDLVRLPIGRIVP